MKRTLARILLAVYILTICAFIVVMTNWWLAVAIISGSILITAGALWALHNA